ncbi:putative strictosidine synthase transcription factor WD40-like family [Rosa chinensis]|uniref:Putative strictosidine synthase transcription factor WD40-like family n=1 Tax=Rosa chinensis TaxID=74649 RepID=A0A2P6RKT8_ROSCH|nr:protein STRICTOSIDINE SYNTHASE-LIKE 4 isoform X1 [Rosa chinensis]PRQ47035.1 putative strictosidine synthase transcription factor WD40-like family [Rosa chinensis]
MALKHLLTSCSGFVLACLLAFTVQLYLFSPISPVSLELPPPSSSPLPQNNILQRVIKIGDGVLLKPEDIALDKEGTLYTATRDGWIKRLHRNGSWEDWKMLNSHTLLGITITNEGDLVACDVDQGLLKVTENGVTVLASHVNGSKIRFADDVIEASDGSLYFSVASTKFGLHNWYLDVLEAKPHGQLLKYDPSSNETSILLEGLGFANGVAVSEDQDYLVVCETWKFRCLRYWLKGDKRGQTEIFIENLPGAPDNINLAPDGSFWIALLKLTSDGLEFVHSSRAAKHLIATSGKLVELVSGLHKKATVVNVGADGKIIKKLEDPNGSVMSFVTSAVEFDNHLYLGSLQNNFIGKLPLNVA